MTHPRQDLLQTRKFLKKFQEISFSGLCPPELAAKDLGAQEGKDAEKEKKENEKGDDRFDRVDKRPEEILQRSPIPKTRICLNL